MSEQVQREASGRAAWRIRRVEQTGSTNADLTSSARAGEAEGAVLVTRYQSAGRGRLTRGWTSPPDAGLTFSVLLRPTSVPMARWGWLPLIAGLAVTDAAFRVAGVSAGLKWPNDVLIDDRKLCGILAEVVLGAAAPGSDDSEPAGEAVVIGIGLNVASTADQLPPTGISLRMVAGRELQPDALLQPVLQRLDQWYARWCAAGGDAEASGIRAVYQQRSATLGRHVTIEASGGKVEGVAVDVDRNGRLVMRSADGELSRFGSGDVVHATLR